MLINVRGTSGSGKTHTVRGLMDVIGQPWADVHNLEGKVIAHVAHFRMQPVYVIGDYSSNVCGGCDKIRSQNEVCSLVRHFSQFGHVVFEGLILSHLYARYVALDDEMTGMGEHYVWAFLDTPIELCLERITQRRLDVGNTKPLNPYNTISKHESILRCIEKVRDERRAVVILDHNNPVEQLIELLNSDDQFTYELVEESFR